MSEDRVDRLRHHVEVLAAGPRHRAIPGSLQRARDYCVRELGASGWEITQLPFRSSQSLLRTSDYGRAWWPVGAGGPIDGVNLIAHRGNPDGAIWLLAHLDSVHSSPGADDNASGVAALLELARHDLGPDVAIVLTDSEEAGVLGARYLAKRRCGQLGTGRHDTSTARAYEAAVEGSVKVMNRFGADFIDIQGDGGFGLFWGDGAIARALCTGVTIRSFSSTLVDKLETKWGASGGPETGFKVGIAMGRVLVKNLGTPRNQAEQEAVWAGRPVLAEVPDTAGTDGNVDLLVHRDRVWASSPMTDEVLTLSVEDLP